MTTTIKDRIALPPKDAQKTNMTEGAVKVAVHRLRHRYGELLRQEIARTVSSPAEVDEELRYLISVVGR